MAWRIANEHQFSHLLDTHTEGGLCNQAEVVQDSSSHSRIYVCDLIHVGSRNRSDQDPFDRRSGWCYTRGRRHCKPAKIRIIVLLDYQMPTDLCHYNNFITR